MTDMKNYWEMVRRNVTSADEHWGGGRITLRRFWEDGAWLGADVFVGGWRVGQYKTERGALARVAKELAL